MYKISRISQSHCTAHYFSDIESDNGIEPVSSDNREEVKPYRRKWLPMCTYNIKNDVIMKMKMIVYVVKVIQIQSWSKESNTP